MLENLSNNSNIKKTSIDAIDNIDNNIDNNINNIDNIVNKMSDIHKYLKELWSEREINIIINLFHELDNKTDKKEIGEKQYIHDNIMQFCMMKETKLNKYIEENSHFLN